VRVLRGLHHILTDLRDWADQRPPSELVVPRVYPEGRILDNKRYDLQPAIDALLDEKPDLVPELVDPDRMDTDAAEAVALAIVVQGWEFIRGGGWDDVDEGDFGETLACMERSAIMLDPLKDLLECHAQGGDRSPILKALSSSGHHLRQSVREGRRQSADQPAHDGSGIEESRLDAPPSFDSLDSISDEALSATRKESRTATQRLRERLALVRKRLKKKKREREREREAARTSTEPQSAAFVAERVSSTGRRRLRIASVFLLAALLGLAGVSAYPLLGQWAIPAPVDYSSPLGIAGIMRLQGDDPVVVFMVGQAWDDMSDGDRILNVTDLARQAASTEAAESIVVRDVRGYDVARSYGEHVVLLH
jgi:hypothetical protein